MALETVLNTLELPGPTGESNRLSLHPRGRILCLGPKGVPFLGQKADILEAEGRLNWGLGAEPPGI